MTATFDTTFGTTAPGYTITNNFHGLFGDSASYSSQVIDSNNNIYVTGEIGDSISSGYKQLLLVKYTNTGALDKTFGAGKGYIIGDYYTGKVSRGDSLVLDSNGNIIVTGYIIIREGGLNNSGEIRKLLLAKYKSNGELDKSFGGGKGWLVGDFGKGYNSYGSSLALDTNGNIVVTGDLFNEDLETRFLLLARYKPNGDLDKSFGGNGTGWAAYNKDLDELGIVLVINKTTGSIIVYAGTPGSSKSIIKYTSSGLLDTSFGSGKGYIDIEYFGKIALDNKGRILFCSLDKTFYKSRITRYEPNGDLDTTFGENNGYTITNLPGEQNNNISLLIDSTGSIVVSANYSVSELSIKSVLIRYNSNGITDPTFGDNGIAVLDFVGSNITQVSLDNNGKLVVCGFGYNYKKDNGVLVARVLNNTVEPICLVAGTPILTDQGLVPIELIQPKKHTISNKAIVAITKTVTPEKVLVCFEANSLGINCPSQRTIMTSGHEVLYKGQLVQAKHFVGRVDGVHTVPYNGKDVLYNVLQEQHGLMRVNNMVLETLHPENKVAKQILGNLN